MKKAVIAFLICVTVLFSFTACSDNTNDIPLTPAEMFEYEENEDGGITITKYIGELTEVRIPEKINDKSVTSIGEYAFNHNYNLACIIIPDTVTSVQHQAFEGCSLLNTVILPRGLTEIGKSVFADCLVLETVELPETLLTIPGGAFRNCDSLSSITLPKGLTKLGYGAFEGCVSLKHITIPASVTEWESSVFHESGLETITFEEGLATIDGQYAFVGTNITKLEIPSTVKSIAFGAFMGCKSLTSVTLREGLVSVGDSAFSGSNINEITIPSTVENIQDVAFDECSSLEKVKFEGEAPQDFQYIHDAYLESGEYFPIIAFDVHFTVYYHEGAKGFTSPEWEGYPTEIW